MQGPLAGATILRAAVGEHSQVLGSADLDVGSRVQDATADQTFRTNKPTALALTALTLPISFVSSAVEITPRTVLTSQPQPTQLLPAALHAGSQALRQHYPSLAASVNRELMHDLPTAERWPHSNLPSAVGSASAARSVVEPSDSSPTVSSTADGSALAPSQAAAAVAASMDEPAVLAAALAEMLQQWSASSAATAGSCGVFSSGAMAAGPQSPAVLDFPNLQPHVNSSHPVDKTTFERSLPFVPSSFSWSSTDGSAYGSLTSPAARRDLQEQDDLEQALKASMQEAGGFPGGASRVPEGEHDSAVLAPEYSQAEPEVEPQPSDSLRMEEMQHLMSYEEQLKAATRNSLKEVNLVVPLWQHKLVEIIVQGSICICHVTLFFSGPHVQSTPPLPETCPQLAPYSTDSLLAQMLPYKHCNPCKLTKAVRIVLIYSEFGVLCRS